MGWSLRYSYFKRECGGLRKDGLRIQAHCCMLHEATVATVASRGVVPFRARSFEFSGLELLGQT